MHGLTTIATHSGVRSTTDLVLLDDSKSRRGQTKIPPVKESERSRAIKSTESTHRSTPPYDGHRLMTWYDFLGRPQLDLRARMPFIPRPGADEIERIPIELERRRFKQKED